MSIYTRTGDKGLTSLYGGKRVSKSDLRVEAYGSIDELTSFIGIVAAKTTKQDKKFLLDIQKDLYKMMSYLSGMDIDLEFLKKRAKEFENKIDQLDKKLPRLTKFIIPGETEISSWFHVLRTVCRRVERNVVRILHTNHQSPITVYLNRLSDLFFTFARFYNRGHEVVV